MKDEPILLKLRHLWTKAIGKVDYDKSEWIELERELIELLEKVRGRSRVK